AATTRRTHPHELHPRKGRTRLAMRHISRIGMVLTCAALTATACGGTNDSGSGGSATKLTRGGGDLPPAASPFSNPYNKYLPGKPKSVGVALAPPTQSSNDVQKLVSNTQTLVSRGAQSIVMAPQDTAAIAPTLDQLAAKKVSVVSVDTRPDTGKVYMVVRADN